MKPNHNTLSGLRSANEVVYTMSKIQNETKSQLIRSTMCYVIVVYTMSKIQNETKSQRNISNFVCNFSCLYYVKDTK